MTHAYTKQVDFTSNMANETLGDNVHPGYELPYGVPKMLRKLDAAEREFIDRETDSERINSTSSTLEGAYSIESNNWIELRGFWIDCEHLEVFKAPHYSPKIDTVFFRCYRGRQQALLLVHPASLRLYKPFLYSAVNPGDLASERFLASPTSSSRTLIAWRVGYESMAVMVKLSLDRTLCGLRRTIDRKSAIRCVGISTTLECIETSLPKSFSYMAESVGIIPKSVPGGAMLVREVPRSARKSSYYPFFALYASPKRGIPLIVRLAERHGSSILTYFEEIILKPYARMWVDLALNHGIATEAHAQNILLEVRDNDALPLRFVHRDFEDLSIDFRYRAVSDMSLPARMPIHSSFDDDYEQKLHKKWMWASLATYFGGGFLFMLNKRWNEWRRSGEIKEDHMPQGHFENRFRSALCDVIGIEPNLRIPERQRYMDIVESIYRQRLLRYRYRSIPEAISSRDIIYLK